MDIRTSSFNRAYHRADQDPGTLELEPQNLKPYNKTLNPRPKLYLNLKSMQNNGLYGCYYGVRAIILHTFEGLGKP